MNHNTLSGHEMIEAVKGAVATNEVNAAMGIICATQQLAPPERFRAYF